MVLTTGVSLGGIRKTTTAGVDAGPVVRRGRLLRLLEQCRHQLLDDLAPRLDTAFERVDDALYDLADKAENDRLYTTWFDALRLVRREREGLKRRMLRHLEEAVAQFQDYRPPAAGEELLAVRDSEDLALVGHDDLEESLVIANLVSKADSCYQAPLRELADDFADLVEAPALEPSALPISPQSIISALRAALQGVPQLALATALVIYKVFDKQVMDHLEPTYAACVHAARQLGMAPRPARGRVAPVRATALPREEQPEASAPADPSPPPGDPAMLFPPPLERAPDAPPAAGATCSFNDLARLLDGHPTMLRSDAALPEVARDELLDELTRLQDALPEDGGEPLAPDAVRQTLAAQLGVTSGRSRGASGGPRRLARQDADTMDLVFLLFEQVLAAPDVPEPIKLLISRLQIPYVKLALLDPRFFEFPEHPARRLLNRIAFAAIGWSDDGRRDGDPLYALVRYIVERVVTEPQGAPELYAQLDAELSAFLATSAEAVARTEARTVAGAGQRAQHQRAARRVLTVIDERLRGRTPLPMVVGAIIYEGWAEVLRKRYAEQGEGHPAWREALAVLDLLLWSVEPKPASADRRELLRRIPELLRSLREGLATVSGDQRQLARWLRELQALHIAALRGPLPDPGAAAWPEDEPLVPPAPDEGPGADVDALPLGTWLALLRDDGTWLRGKLAWRSHDGEDLLLVDRQGHGVVELARTDLALMLGHDLAQVIGDGRTPLVDRALEAVRRSLALY